MPATAFADRPFLAIWEMTQACDLVCKHCRACADPQRDPLELSSEDGRRLLDAIAEMGTPVVVLTGGDPAKRPDLVALVRHGTSRGLRMGLTPSATPLVTGELLRALAGAGLARLAVSLDGLTAAQHDDFRGVPGSFDRTFEILRYARSLGISTQVNTTVTRLNVRDLEAIARSLVPFEIGLWSVFLVVPTGRATADDVVDAETVEEVLERLAELSRVVPFDVKTTAAPHFRRVLLEQRTKTADIVGVATGVDVDVDGIGRAPRGVNDGAGLVFVSHRGEIFPSGFLPVSCGNVRTDDLAVVYRDHPFMRSLRDTEGLGGKCGDCEYRYVCGGSRARAHATTGDAMAADPACAYVPASTRRRLQTLPASRAGV